LRQTEELIWINTVCDRICGDDDDMLRKSNNKKINTPMGEISVLIDGSEIQYVFVKGEAIKRWFPNVLGRYLIRVNYIPDGKNHKITCILPCDKIDKSYIESGENMECQGFYSKDLVKVSIGTYGDNAPDADFDYDVEYLSNGIQYNIFPDTKTQNYEFGICWIDDVDSDEFDEGTNDRDTQTWLGADPWYYKIIDK